MMTTGKNPPAPRRALAAAWLLVAALACAQGEREQASTDTSAGPTVDSAAAGVVPAAPTRVDSGVRATPADSARRTAADTGTRTARRTTPAASATPAATTAQRTANATGASRASGARTDSAARPNAGTTAATGRATATRDTAGSSPTPAGSSAAPSSASSGAAATQTAAAGPAGRDSLLVSQAEYNGWKTYHVYCYRCHGVEAIGSDIAPNLRQSLKASMTHDAFVQTVVHGRLEKGMPAWKDMISNEKIEELYAYLKARSDGRLAPGRPHTTPKS